MSAALYLSHSLSPVKLLCTLPICLKLMTCASQIYIVLHTKTHRHIHLHSPTHPHTHVKNLLGPFHVAYVYTCLEADHL